MQWHRYCASWNATALLIGQQVRAHRWKKENAMDWDLFLVTGALIGVFMLIALLGRIWKDQTPRTPKSEPKESHEFGAPSGEVDRVS